MDLKKLLAFTRDRLSFLETMPESGYAETNKLLTERIIAADARKTKTITAAALANADKNENNSRYQSVS